MLVWLLSAYEPVLVCGDGLAAIVHVAVAQRSPSLFTTWPAVGNEAPNAENMRSDTSVTPAAATFGSSGIANSAVAPQVDGVHGSAVWTLRSNDVR